LIGIGVAVVLLGALGWQQRHADATRLAETQERLAEVERAAKEAQQLDQAGREAADEARRAEEAARNPELEGTGVVLFPSEQTVLPVKGIRRVAVGDLRIANATVVDPDQVVLIGASVGTTSLLTWDDKNRRTRYPINVAARPQSITIEQGGTMPLPVPGLRRVAVGDSLICDVKEIGTDQLRVTGVTPGITSLIVWSDPFPSTNDIKRQSFEVRVIEARPRAK
jgi:Flp pilus assembly secretin CpaC